MTEMMTIDGTNKTYGNVKVSQTLDNLLRQNRDFAHFVLNCIKMFERNKWGTVSPKEKTKNRSNKGEVKGRYFYDGLENVQLNGHSIRTIIIETRNARTQTEVRVFEEFL